MAKGASNSLPQDLATEIGVEDLYEFLGVSSTSTEKEITSGYRKKALKYHPDKNPDDPKAADLFQKLSKAYNILTDPAAKGAYDKWLKAKFAAKQRHEELNAKRRKLKESLESRESQYTQNWIDEIEAAKKMQKEIERLREDGFRKIKEQEEALRRQFEAPAPPDDDVLPTLKVTWKAKAGDKTNGGYSKDILTDVFSKYGPVHHVLVSSKRNGKALVSFHHVTDSLCLLDTTKLGSAGNPLKTTWVSGDPSTTVHSGGVTGVRGGGVTGVRSGDVTGVRGGGVTGVRGFQENKKDRPGGDSTRNQYLERDSDYESLTLMRLRQAQERKRLCEQLQEQEPS